ncbi:MAG: glycoside hydrolase family 97 catalytic domain-containing protein [Bryobacteraceae bacterium]|nr:glycoside hydrolase family 97 catalytic domain-containing protein [Bryobacteraceae bacterium]
MLRELSLMCSLAVCAVAEPLVLLSPDGNVRVSFDLRDGRPVYSVAFGGREVIAASGLGLVPEGAARLDSRMTVVRSDSSGHSGTWRPVYGERSEIPDKYRSLTVVLREDIAPRRELSLEFRAYDEGIALRYVVPAALTVGEELTEFHFPAGTFAWETQRAQELYKRVDVSQMSRSSERPLLLELPGGLWAAVAEAGVENYASMFLAGLGPKANGVISRLMGPVRRDGPFHSPWRVVLIGSRPGALLEHNYLLLNLSPESRVANTSFVKPGKVLREVTLSTRGGREAIDFAAKNGIQYIEYDAGWYGHEYEEQSDARTVNIDPQRLRKEPEYQGLDLRNVIDYGKSKGIGVFLYVNRRAMERQLDEILPLYQNWGVSGVKYGFVNVHAQGWTTWLYNAVAKAAKYGLMLDIHDEFRPTGMSRTWPNLMTQEGILGNEGFPDATHSTILPFTRMLAGAADYTFCWLSPRLKNTWGHQLAMTVVIYSPLQFVYWYDRPAELTAAGESPGMEWFRRVPTVWDDTRVVDGQPGEFAVVARRKGAEWYVGAVTNESQREVRLPLEMLESGRKYFATVYADGSGPKDIRKSVSTVRRGDVLTLSLAARGGAAVVVSEAR